MKNRLACLFCLMFYFAAPLIGYAEDRAIKDLIHKFIAFQKDVRIHGSDYIANAERSIQFSTDEFINTMNDALKKHDLDKLGGLALVSHSESLHDFEMEKNGNLVIVTFLEDYEEVFYRTQGYTYTKDGITHEVPTGYENTTKGVNRKNKVTLREEDNGWIIIEHKIYEFSIPKTDKSKLDVDAFNTSFSRNRENVRRIFPNIDLLPSRPVNKYEIEEVEMPQEQIEEVGQRSFETSLAPLLATWVWNGNISGSYSDVYALNPNTAQYRVYDGADCTNFASQCLYFGGKPYRDDGLGRDHFSSWYYGLFTFTTSYPWAVSFHLAAHLFCHTNSNLFPTSIYELERGDFIFIDKTSDGPTDHTTIISEMVYNPSWPDAYVNYHSVNTYRKRILEVMQAYPSGLILLAVIGNAYTN